MRPFVSKMKVDENKQFSLVNIAQMKKNKRLIETDNNAFILDVLLNKNIKKPKREEILNLKNKVCQEAFREETEKNKELLECFQSKFSLEKQFKKWKSIMDGIISKCFRKIRIIPKTVETGTEKLLKERLKLKSQAKLSVGDNDMKESVEKKIEQIEEEIGEDVIKENFMGIAETVKDLGIHR